MYIFYNEKTDYLEVLEKKCRNFSVLIDDGIFEIRSQTHKKKIGYGLEDASKYLDEVNLFDPFVKLAAHIKIARLKRGFTQAQMARKMGVGLLPYQRLESGRNNPTFKTLLKVKSLLPEINLETIAA